MLYLHSGKNIINIYSILLLSLSFAATPSISNLTNSTYVEQNSAYILDSNISFSNGTDYASGYIEFSVSPATSSDFLTLSTVGGASTTNGVISIVGTTVYYGNGSTAIIIGNVDGTYNGQNGQNLKIIFSNNFVNGDFQIGADGDTSFAGWTAMNVTHVRLDGNYQIAGQNTPVDQTWPGSNGSLHDNATWSSTPAQATILTDNYQTAPDIAIRMDTGRNYITQGYGIIRGPYIYSNGTVTLEAGDQVSFDWKALADGDAFDAYGYIIDVDNGNTLTILDQTGTTSGQETNWATETITIASGQDGTYRFVFVCGSYDLSGGRAVGGKLMIDDVSVTQAIISGTITDANLSTIAQKFMYNNTSDKPAASKTLNVSAKNATVHGGNTGTATATITITPVNDVPVSITVHGSGNEGGTITTILSATDVDNSGDNKLQFDGVDDYVELPDFSSLQDMSFSGWIKIDTRNYWERIFDFGKGGSGDMFLTTMGGRTGGNLEMTIHHGAGTYTINPGVTLDDGAWHHVVFTYDKGGAGMNFYIDGVNKGSNSYNTTSFADFGSGQNFYLGKSNWNDPYFDGTMNDITLWNIALSQSQVQDLMNNNFGGNSPIAHWKFNEGTGTTLTDHSGNNYHGTIQGNPQWEMVSSNFTFSIVNQPTNITGSISLGAVDYASNTYTAVATYTHDGSELTSDSFTYRTNDGNDNSNTATANITITGINDAPVASAVNGSGNEGGTITTTLTATDVDDSNPSGFTFSIVSQPTNITGNVSIASVSYSSGTFTAVATYTHDDSQTTSDSFTYKSNDGDEDSNTATASITVTAINDAPVTVAVSGSGNEGGTITTTLSATDIDDSNSAGFNFSIVSQPTGITGSVSIGTVSYSSGTFTAVATYTHDGSEATSDSFTYKANDGTDDSNTATATITITGINDAPVATAVSGSGVEGGTITTTLTATDVDDSNSAGFNFSIVSQPADITSSVSIGDVSYSSGTFTAVATYTHDGSEAASDSFTYRANDGEYNSSTATATITIAGINDAPVATAVSGSGVEGGTITTTLTATDVDDSNTTGFNFNSVSYPTNITGIFSKGPVSYSSGTFTLVITYTHDGSETTSDSFTYKANDGDDDSNTSTATITITAVNDAPIATAVNSSGNEGETITTTLIATDVDESNSAGFSFSIVRQPENSNNDDVVVIGTPSYSSGTFTAFATYTHDGSELTSDSFTYQASDGTDYSNEATATITVSAVNDAPIATAVSGSGAEGGTITTTLTATDVDDECVGTSGLCDSSTGDSNFTFSIVSQPTNSNNDDVVVIGTPSYSSGTFTAVATYTHDGSQTTSDSFTYKAKDGEGDSNTATVTITVSAVNDAPVASAVNGGGRNNQTITTTLIATDVDNTDPTNFFIIFDQPSSSDNNDVVVIGTASYASGTFTAVATYTHDNTGTNTDAFTYKANDGTDYSNLATATITISDNEASVAATVSGSGAEGGTITTTLTATDADDTNDATNFTFSIVGPPTNGSVSIDPSTVSCNSGTQTCTAIATYTHDDSETTSDSFTYNVFDNEEDSKTATANITITPVNDAPVAAAVNGSGNEGGTISTTLTATDVDDECVGTSGLCDSSTGDSNFTFIIISQPTNSNNDDDVVIGTSSYSSGTFTAVATYTHDGSETTSDSFTYKANDGTDDSSTPTATITVSAVNDAPVAADVSVNGTESGAITTNLTATDIDDTDHTGFTFSIVSSPLNGSVIIDTPSYSSGTFTAVATYTHDGSETTSDSFTYKANDGTDDSNTATATITIGAINDAPVAKAVNSSGNEGGTITTLLTATDVDDTEIAGFTFSIVSMPTNITGSVTYGGISYSSGTFTEDVTYTHDGSETTSDSLTYKANDGEEDSNTATATITITAVNDAPVSTDVSGIGNEGGTISATLIATDVDDSEPTGFTFSIISQPINKIDSVSIGDVSYNSGTFTVVATYIHDGSETTSDSFTYKANDGTDDSNTTTATFSIAAINDAPVAMAVNSSGNEGDIITTTLIATDIDDIDTSTFTFSIITQPTNITGSISLGNVSYDSGTFSAVATYTHDDSQTTSDSFTYKANDGEEDSNTTTATISITAINDAPVLDAIISQTANEDESLSITLSAIDVDGDNLTFAASSLDTINVTTIVENSILTLAPSSDWYGTADILVQVTDNGFGTLSDSKSFTLTIVSMNDKPGAVTYTAPEEGHNIKINYNNLDNKGLTFGWSPSMDVDKEDTLIYLFHAEWDTTNQVDHPVTTLFQSSLLGTKYSVSYEELWDALDFNNRLWFNQPVMKWKVDVTDGLDTTFSTEVSTINIGYYDLLSLEQQRFIPTEYALFQNYPNPFNPITQIKYDLPVAGRVQLTIYNLLGQEVTSLIKSWQEPGHYSITWNSQNDHKVMVSSGMYFYYLETQEFKQIKKMILLK